MNTSAITYIAHSGFLVETEQTLLLFDYYKGPLPLISDKKALYVFVSHRHSDHFNPEIFTLSHSCPHTQFILSSDIWKSRIPETLNEQTVRLKPNTTWKDSYIEVQTLKSTDEGLAFLVHTEGKTYYHAGDLNDWRWEGEPEDWNRRMFENYKTFLEPVRNLHIDMAFLPLDPRQEKNYCLGMDYFLELTDTDTVFPMHCWEDYSVIDRWFSEHPDSPYKERIRRISYMGEKFT